MANRLLADHQCRLKRIDKHANLVLMGIGFTGVFVLCMILLVRLVVANAA